MHLREARLCLDCEELHTEYRCPACASDQFSYLTRWVPVPGPAARAGRPVAPPPETEVYRRLVRGEPERRRRFVKRTAVGLGAAVGIAGLFFGARRARRSRDDEPSR